MSDKKYMIYHIISEIILLVSIVGYFYRRTSKLESRVGDLEAQVGNLTAHIQSIHSHLTLRETQPAPVGISSRVAERPVVDQSQCLQQVKPKQLRTDIPFDEMITRKHDSASEPEEEVEVDTTVLDAELAEELAELSSSDKENENN